MEQARLEELEMIEREYKRLKALVDDAAKGAALDDYSGEMLIYTDVDSGQIIDASRAALNFLGYSLSELQAFCVESIETRTEQALRLIENEQVFEIYTAVYRQKNGLQETVKVRKQEVRKNGGYALSYALEDKSLYSQFLHELLRREDNHFQFREKLKVLNEINLELGRLQSLDDLCRRSVELGMERLELDRLSIWLIDQKQGLMLGTYGVDEQGHIRDERLETWRYGAGDVTEFLAGRREPIIVNSDAPIYNDRSEQVGTGWHISVPLFNGDEFIGFMGVDNFIRKQPFQNYLPELLRLYGASIGHLAAHQREQETIRKLNSAIEHSASMVLILNQEKQVSFANAAFYKFSEYSPTEVLGKAASQFFPPKLLTGAAALVEIALTTKSGLQLDTLASISDVSTGDVPEHYVLVLEDISLLKQSKAREMDLLLEQERLQLLHNFISDVGHEFKTPLSIIKTSNYFLAKSSDVDKRQQQLGKIEDAVSYLNHLLDMMLKIVSLHSQPELQLQPLALDQMLGKIVDKLSAKAASKQLDLQMEIQAHQQIKGDAELLWQALEGIVRNAIDYTPEQGQIRLELVADTNFCQITVQDTGIGIPPDEIGKIFQHFYRVDKARSSRNAGLGLTLTKRIIELHGGSIQVESTVAMGSCFVIRLPGMLGSGD